MTSGVPVNSSPVHIQLRAKCQVVGLGLGIGLVVGLVFDSYESTCLACCWLLKFASDELTVFHLQEQGSCDPSGSM